MQISYAAKHKKYNIFILSSTNEYNLSMYFYLDVDNNKEAVFQKDLETKENINLSDYGVILEKGVGKVPDSESIVKMQDEYGFITPQAL